MTRWCGTSASDSASVKEITSPEPQICPLDRHRTRRQDAMLSGVPDLAAAGPPYTYLI